MKFKNTELWKFNSPWHSKRRQSQQHLNHCFLCLRLHNIVGISFFSCCWLSNFDRVFRAPSNKHTWIGYSSGQGCISPNFATGPLVHCSKSTVCVPLMTSFAVCKWFSVLNSLFIVFKNICSSIMGVSVSFPTDLCYNCSRVCAFWGKSWFLFHIKLGT